LRWKNLTRSANTATSPPASEVKVFDVSSARQLARDGAVQRPRLRDHRKLGEHESQRHPSPAGSLDHVQRPAHVGEDPEDRPDTDQRADAEHQVDPADPLRLSQLGDLDAGSAGHRRPQPRQQALIPLNSANRDRVERRTLQVHQGTACRVGVEHPARCRGRALGTHPHRHRG
jgi:hypothetical protein